MGYVIAAYAIVIAVLVAYALRLASERRRLSKQCGRLATRGSKTN